MRNKQEYTIWNGVTPKAVTSSTDATPIVVTATGHGFATGDIVVINGHTTNIAANGVYKITKLTADTFSLQDINTGASVAGSGAGAGASGVVMPAKIIPVQDFRNMLLQVDTSGSANFTFKVAGSIGKLLGDEVGTSDTPNFGGTQSKSNPYSFIQIINLDTAAAVNGATGVTSAGTDIHNLYEVNVNGLKYICLVPTAYSAGVLSAKVMLLDNQ